MQFYYIDEYNNQQGPVSIEQLRQVGCKPTTLVWHEGMSDWQQASQVAELAGMFPPTYPAAPQPVTPPPTPATAPVDRYAGLEPEPKKGNNKAIIAVAGLAAFAAVAAGVFFMTRGNGDSDGAADVDTTAVTVDSTAVEAPTFVAELKTTEKTAKAYFIANSGDSELIDGDEPQQYYYLEKTYEVDWPSEANFDTEPLQSAINYAMFKVRNPQVETAAKGFLSRADMAEGEGFDFVRNTGSKKEATGDDAFMYNWSHQKYCNRITDKMPKNVVGFATGGYEYMGGAHGMPYQTGVVNYDCEQGHPIAYGDIFTPGTDGKILSMLKAARKKMKEADPNMLPTRIPKEVMTIYASKVSFAYSAYEIGCYAEGEVEVELSYGQIEPYLTEYGKELFTRE